MARKITIEGFSIHPLMRRVADLCSLDDLGDAGGAVDARYEIDGHAQWSIWSALAGPRGTAINASSGYNAEAESDILMNTLVIGAPGAMLPMSDYDDSPAGRTRRRLRIALSRWRRRSTQWRPLWLDSEPGRLGLEPGLRSWGRLETFAGRQCLTALALRSPALHLLRPLGVETFTGRWGLVAQDDAAVDASARLALIPFAAGAISLGLARPVRRVTAVYPDGERPPASARIEGNRVHIRVDSDAVRDLLGMLVV